MKRSIYTFVIISMIALFSISGCSEKPDPLVIDLNNPKDPNNPNNTIKSCWEFTIKVKTSIKGVSMPGYPQTVTATAKECNLTEKEAEQLVKEATTTSSSTVQGITATVESTCTKRKL